MSPQKAEVLKPQPILDKLFLCSAIAIVLSSRLKSKKANYRRVRVPDFPEEIPDNRPPSFAVLHPNAVFRRVLSFNSALSWLPEKLAVFRFDLERCSA